MRLFLSTLVQDSYSLLLPHACLVCHRPTARCDLCGRCQPIALEYNSCYCCYRCQKISSDLDWTGTCSACQHLANPIFRIRYLWHYSSLARDLIQVMKYKPSARLARWAGEQMAMQVLNFFGDLDWDFLVPVPSSRQSLKFRYFNQCDLLCAQISKKHRALTTLYTGLTHCGYRQVQASLSHDARISNVKHAFKARPKFLNNKRILLVDDVITTGATSNSATLALYEAGAAAVDVYALAHNPQLR